MPHAAIPLTETEIACGVTPEQVTATRAQSLVTNGRVVLPANTPPALAGAVAKQALGVDEVEHLGHNQIGYPVCGIAD